MVIYAFLFKDSTDLFCFRFPLPDIPTGWKPDPRRVWAKDKENFQEPPPPPAASQSHAQWKRSKISAGQVSNQFCNFWVLFSHRILERRTARRDTTDWGTAISFRLHVPKGQRKNPKNYHWFEVFRLSRSWSKSICSIAIVFGEARTTCRSSSTKRIPTFYQ
jgi:hypothetical protein